MHQFTGANPLSGSWMEACLFKCQICWDFETTIGKEFAEHISSRHQMTEADYEETFESLMFAPSHVECPRCEARVLHREKDISEHQVNDWCIKGLPFMTSALKGWGRGRGSSKSRQSMGGCVNFIV